MTTSDTASILAQAMSDEIGCFDAYIEAQRAFTEAIRAREWTCLQDTMVQLEGMAAELAEREAVRAEAFERLRVEVGCEAGGLYRVALLVPEPARTDLTDLYRRLKLSAMRAKFANASAGDYAAGSRDLLLAVLEELFPEKKGRIYGRSGRAVAPGHAAILLDSSY